jgi:methylated-DNA-[protein]-cysteine S-methyltransferase
MSALRRRVFESPVGTLIALASVDGLCSLEFDVPGRGSRLRRRLDRWFAPYAIVEAGTSSDAANRGADAILDATGHWLSAYFGERPTATVDPPLDLRGTPFELAVWRALRRVGCGATSTYGSIAAALGRPGASRAVGLANGSNPVAIIVPCHRIIGSDGSLTGYGGGLERKRWLLGHESPQASERLF